MPARSGGCTRVSCRSACRCTTCGGGNWKGAVNLMERGLHLLSAYPAICQGVQVEALRRSSERVLQHLVSEGRPGVEDFDWDLAPKIEIAEYPIQTKGES